jgi:hypothetical protein
MPRLSSSDLAALMPPGTVVRDPVGAGGGLNRPALLDLARQTHLETEQAITRGEAGVDGKRPLDPLAAYKRRQGGKKAQRQGAVTESALEHYHDVLEREGLAKLRKLNVPTRVDPLDPAKRIVTGPSEVDYWGVIGFMTRRGESMSGRCVAIECKHTDGGNMPVVAGKDPRSGKVPPGINMDQLAFLLGVHDMGGLAAVVWQRGEEWWIVDGPGLRKIWSQAQNCDRGPVYERLKPEEWFERFHGPRWLHHLLGMGAGGTDGTDQGAKA